MWDVQEILAERTSITGTNEVLVVWKTSWIPKANMIADGPVMNRFEGERKWKFVSSAGTLLLPVQPGTTLAVDCATAVALRKSAPARSLSESEGQMGQRQTPTTEPGNTDRMARLASEAPPKRQNNGKR